MSSEHEQPRSGIGPRIDLGVLMDDPSLGDALGPTLLRRSDGKALLYPAAINTIHGQPGHGKTWAALFAICQALRDDERVALIDYENAPPYTALRLRELGLTSSETAGLDYRHASGAVTPEDVAEVIGRGPALVVVDSVAEALSAAGLVENEAADVARWIAGVPRLFAEAGACVLLLDHMRKDGGRGPRGSSHKLAGVSGVSLGIEVEQPWARDVAGSALLVVAKDRLGYVGPQDAPVARVRFLPGPDGELTVVVEPPGDDAARPVSPASPQRGRDLGALTAVLAGLVSPLRTASADEEVVAILGWSRQRARDRIAEAIAAGVLMDDAGLLRLVTPDRAHLRLVEGTFPGAGEVEPA